MSNPARASAAAAAGGAVNTAPESGSALESGAIGLSRFEGDVRGRQRVAQGEKRVERVAFQQPLLRDAPTEIDIPDGVKPERIRRLLRALQCRHAKGDERDDHRKLTLERQPRINRERSSAASTSRGPGRDV